MKSLKLKVFEVLANIISINEFEQWLYNEPEIHTRIEYNSFIYDIVTINYKNKDAIIELKNIAFKEYNYDEFILYLVHNNCINIVNADSFEKVIEFVLTINNHFNIQAEYKVLHIFNDLYYDIDLVECKIYRKKDVLRDIQSFAQSLIEKLEALASDQEKIQVLKNGISNN